MSDDERGSARPAELAEARAMFRLAAKQAIHRLADLRLCQKLEALDPSTIAEIASRQAVMDRLDRRAEELGLQGDFEVARTEVGLTLARQRRRCAATDLRLYVEIRSFDEAAGELGGRIEFIATNLRGRSLQPAPQGSNRERARIRDYFDAAASWSELASQCVTQRVSGFADRQNKQHALETRADLLVERAGRAGLGWDLEVAAADRSSPPRAIRTPVPCRPEIHENALRQWETAIEQFEALLDAIEGNGGL